MSSQKPVDTAYVPELRQLQVNAYQLCHTKVNDATVTSLIQDIAANCDKITRASYNDMESLQYYKMATALVSKAAHHIRIQLGGGGQHQFSNVYDYYIYEVTRIVHGNNNIRQTIEFIEELITVMVYDDRMKHTCYVYIARIYYAPSVGELNEGRFDLAQEYLKHASNALECANEPRHQTEDLEKDVKLQQLRAKSMQIIQSGKCHGGYENMLLFVLSPHLTILVRW